MGKSSHSSFTYSIVYFLYSSSDYLSLNDNILLLKLCSPCSCNFFLPIKFVYFIFLWFVWACNYNYGHNFSVLFALINSAFTVHKFCFICQLCSFLFLVFGGNQEDWGGSEYLGEVLPPPTETSRWAVTDVACC